MDTETPGCPICGEPSEKQDVTSVHDNTRTYVLRCKNCTPMSGRALGRELAEAMALPGGRISSITIEAAVGEVATVTVKMFVRHGDRVHDVIRQFGIYDLAAGQDEVA